MNRQNEMNLPISLNLKYFCVSDVASQFFLFLMATVFGKGPNEVLVLPSGYLDFVLTYLCLFNYHKECINHLFGYLWVIATT